MVPGQFGNIALLIPGVAKNIYIFQGTKCKEYKNPSGNRQVDQLVKLVCTKLIFTS